LLVGLGAWAYASEQDDDQGGEGQRGRGADAGGQVQALGECLPGRLQQGRAEPVGELAGHRHRPAQGVRRRRCRLVGDPGRDRPGHLAAVGGGADHPQDRDAQVPARLADGRGEAKALMEGAITWKASAGSPPCARGSVRGAMILVNSTIDPGQPWVISSGNASGCPDRWWMKWMSRPSISVVKWSNLFSADSLARQSYSVRQ
jgi:hypothetical protein